MSEAREEKHAPQTGAGEGESQEKRPQQGSIRPSTPTSGAPGSPAELRRIREEHLDKTIEDTFPSSDPPSSIPDPGEEDPRAA